MWNEESGYLEDTSHILTEVRSLRAKVEGVTFLGGEPLDQSAAVAEIASGVQSMGLSVIVFTGHEYEYLRNSNDPHVHSLLRHTDLLIDGPFRFQEKDFSRPWVGSRNQRYHFLSSRYVHLKDRLHLFRNGVEVRILPDGCVKINGMADLDTLRGLFH